jgi:serine O-acetyltransferase
MNAINLYRIARGLHQRGVPLLPKALYYVNYLIFNSSLPYTAAIGEGSRCAYGGMCVVIHADAKIGRGVTLGQCITVGGRSRHPQAPEIGDDVYIGAGARVLGPIRVGSGSIIAPNAVVIHDVPPRSIVGGVPARILRTDIDWRDYI